MHTIVPKQKKYLFVAFGLGHFGRWGTEKFVVTLVGKCAENWYGSIIFVHQLFDMEARLHLFSFRKFLFLFTPCWIALLDDSKICLVYAGKKLGDFLN